MVSQTITAKIGANGTCSISKTANVLPFAGIGTFRVKGAQNSTHTATRTPTSVSVKKNIKF
jgi:hypothetical protein